MTTYTGFNVNYLLSGNQNGAEPPTSGTTVTGAQTSNLHYADSGATPTSPQTGVLLSQKFGPANYLLVVNPGTITGTTQAMRSSTSVAYAFVRAFLTWQGFTFEVQSAFRTADRLTLVGTAYDMLGRTIDNYHLHFIGETTIDNFGGSETDGDGVYVAYLTVGDTYNAYAFKDNGHVYKLEEQQVFSDHTDLIFRLLSSSGSSFLV